MIPSHMNANGSEVLQVMHPIMLWLKDGQWVMWDHLAERAKVRLIRSSTPTWPSSGPCVPVVRQCFTCPTLAHHSTPSISSAMISNDTVFDLPSKSMVVQ